MKPLFKILKKFAFSIDQLGARVSHKNRVVLVKNLNGALQEIWADQVIGGGPTEIFAGREFKTSTKVARGPEVLGITEILDAGVSGGETATNLLAAVR